MATSFSNYGMTPGQAAEAPKKPHLYIGNLSPRVTDHMLAEIFAVAGPVVSAKIIQDRNFQHGGYNYGFVEYSDMRSAEQALGTLNGRKIFDAEIRVNWAYQGQGNREDTQHHFHVFVGDLSPEVNDDVLGKAFAQFASLSEARVMWDMNSGKSRGYGFLSFRDKADAEHAIATMNGEWLGSRAIRVNWANQKTQTGGSRAALMGSPAGGAGGGGTPVGGAPSGLPGAPGVPGMHAGPSGAGAPGPNGPLSFEQVAASAPEYNTTVYVGNLIPYTTQADLIPMFQNFGYIVEVRMQADRGFAFVKLDTHHNAALAITSLQNQLIHGRPIKCSWGKDRQTDAPGYMMYQQNYSYYPGYAGIPGQPGAQAGVPGVPGVPGVAPADANGNGWDPAAAAFYKQPQWGGFYGHEQLHSAGTSAGATPPVGVPTPPNGHPSM